MNSFSIMGTSSASVTLLRRRVRCRPAIHRGLNRKRLERQTFADLMKQEVDDLPIRDLVGKVAEIKRQG